MSERLKQTKRRFKLRYGIMIVCLGGFNGCAIEQVKLPDSWFQDSETEPLPYYVGVNNLKLLREPGSSSDVLAYLSLHQKVMRSKLNNGYAFVTVVQTGETGWVDNAKLMWKLPAKAEHSPAKTTTEKPEIKKQTNPTELDVTKDRVESQKPNNESVSEPDTVAPSSFNPF